MKTLEARKTKDLRESRNAPLLTRTDLTATATRDVSGALNAVLADVFALYVKTKNFHWHVSGPHFRDYHLLLDEQAAQIEASVDILAERVRKIGGTTIRSIGDIARHQRIKDSNDEHLRPEAMLAVLAEDNRQLTVALRGAHDVCDHHRDVATASMIEIWIDEAERRRWFLTETLR